MIGPALPSSSVNAHDSRRPVSRRQAASRVGNRNTPFSDTVGTTLFQQNAFHSIRVLRQRARHAEEPSDLFTRTRSLLVTPPLCGIVTTRGHVASRRAGRPHIGVAVDGTNPGTRVVGQPAQRSSRPLPHRAPCVTGG